MAFEVSRDLRKIIEKKNFFIYDFEIDLKTFCANKNQKVYILVYTLSIYEKVFTE